MVILPLMLPFLASTILSGPTSAPVAQKAPGEVVDRAEAYKDPVVGLRKLTIGNARFVAGKAIRPRQDRKFILQSTGGQTPFAILVACSDSRVPNEILFDQGVGDLFVVRTAGQVAGEASFGSIEYANAVLGTKLVVVLGHSGCGAVKAAIETPENPPGSISYLINSIRTAVEEVQGLAGDEMTNAVSQNVLNQVIALRKRQPVLARATRDKKLIIVGAVYDVTTGKVVYLPATIKGTAAEGLDLSKPLAAKKL